jgi:hypothetical protein
MREGIVPDFEFKSTAPDAQLDYFHRLTDEADIYFVVNRRDRWDSVECSFRVAGRQPELWNPVTGEIADATAFSQLDRRTIIPLALPPGGSMFVVFRRSTDGRTRGTSLANEPLLTPIRSIDGPWQVVFDPAWGGPAKVTFDSLVDWTDRAEEGIRHYSGTAHYRAEFDLPQDAVAGGLGMRYFLDLGDVRNLASASLNGKPLGVVWTEPFRVEITGAVQAGRNRLSIEVANLWPNRLIGDQQLSPGQRRTETNITKFTGDSPLLPSGLLGPVQILQTEERRVADADGPTTE